MYCLIEGDYINKRFVGSICEEKAANYLVNNGYQIICKNYRPCKIGEIDIIAKNDEFICFVEVKARTSIYFGMPSQSVNRKKQLTIRNIAMIYLKSNFLIDSVIRFDIVEIIFDRIKINNNSISNTTDDNEDIIIKDINLIKNAF
ncbi:MAG TPA: YraN family protein [Clostridia bacterium]|nr:YraN family protein [Clostridia bacterium]